MTTEEGQQAEQQMREARANQQAVRDALIGQSPIGVDEIRPGSFRHELHSSAVLHYHAMLQAGYNGTRDGLRVDVHETPWSTLQRRRAERLSDQLREIRALLDGRPNGYQVSELVRLAPDLDRAAECLAQFAGAVAAGLVHDA